MMLPEKGSDLCIKLIRPPLVGACEGIIFFVYDLCDGYLCILLICP